MINTPYLLFDKALSKEFCELVIAETEWNKADEAKVDRGEDSVKDDVSRITELVWQELYTPIGCVLQSYLAKANEVWAYHVHRMEKVQMSKYDIGGHYNWHMDSKAPVNNEQRKLSIVVRLNDDFEGGELELATNPNENVLKSQGDIVVFPAFLNHRVLPVTKGTRFTAVSWAYGPTFR